MKYLESYIILTGRWGSAWRPSKAGTSGTSRRCKIQDKIRNLINSYFFFYLAFISSISQTRKAYEKERIANEPRKTKEKKDCEKFKGKQSEKTLDITKTEGIGSFRAYSI